MKSTPDQDAKKAEIAAIFAEAASTSAPHRNHPVYRKMANLKLVDHVGMVHNALRAVRDLVIPSSGSGVSSSGIPDDLGAIARNDFIDLLEIINDRLGVALEMEETA